MPVTLTAGQQFTLDAFSVHLRGSVPAGIPTSGLVHRWPLDITHTPSGWSSGTTQDVVGTLTLNLGANILDGLAGPDGQLVLNQDGVSVNTFCNTGTDPAIDFNAHSFSICGWVFLDDNTTTEGGNRRTLFQGTTIGSAGFRVCITPAIAAGSLSVGFDDGNGISSSSVFLPTGSWKQWGYTNAGGGSGGTKTLSIDGASVATTPQSANPDAGTGIFVGSLGGGLGKLDGRSYNICMYDRAITPTEMAAVFAAR